MSKFYRQVGRPSCIKIINLKPTSTDFSIMIPTTETKKFYNFLSTDMMYGLLTVEEIFIQTNIKNILQRIHNFGISG